MTEPDGQAKVQLTWLTRKGGKAHAFPPEEFGKICWSLCSRAQRSSVDSRWVPAQVIDPCIVCRRRAVTMRVQAEILEGDEGERSKG